MTDSVGSFERATASKMRLICCPYAGGAAGLFRPWQTFLSPTIEVVGVRYRGRGARLCEPPLRSIHEIVEDALPQISSLLDVPYALFGHSMGAMVAFELARGLTRQAGLAPAHLFISGLSAPHRRDPGKPIHALPERAFIDEFAGLGGTPPDVLRNADLLELLAPAIRADLEAAYRWKPRIDCDLRLPITVFAGDADHATPLDYLKAWSVYTCGETEVFLYPGGHFFLHDQYLEMCRHIHRCLTGGDIGSRPIRSSKLPDTEAGASTIGGIHGFR